MGTYSPPIITSAGLSVPSQQALLNYLQTRYQSIYGVSINFDNSTSDAQWISLLSLMIADVMNTLVLEYNNRGPSFAIGAALDDLVALNGLTRKPASFSTCLVTLTGTAGTIVNNGVVTDINGNSWNLPTPVTIGVGGTVTVTAIAQIAGPIDAQVGQIIGIGTPVAGWTSVTNPSASVDGVAQETDSQLRARQAISTQLPSISLVTGTLAGIQAIAGVVRAIVDENTTNTTNANGTAGHSIQAVVQGGADLVIATAIYNNKSIGCGTTGTDSQNVVDPITGVTTVISFNRPTPVTIYVTANVHLISPGGTSATITAAQTAILNYLNNLNIGEKVSYTALIAAAMSVNSSLTNPIALVVSLFLGTTPSPVGTSDIVLTFAQIAQSIAADVIVNSV